MAYYGYRLFEIELRERNARKPAPFEDCAGEHYSVIAHRLLRAVTGETKVESKPGEELDPDEIVDGVEGNPFAGRRGVRVVDVEREGHTVWVDVLVGRYGELVTAQGAPGKTADADLTGRAPSDTYRLGFYFPDKGTRGVLVAEDISRACPVDIVRNALLLEGSRAESVHRAKRTRRLEVSEQVPSWWKLILTPMIDEEKVNNLINAGNSQEVKLTRHGVGSGRGRDSVDYEFRAAALSAGQRADLAALITQWGRELMGRRRARPADRSKMGIPSDVEGAAQLSALLGEQITALNFDDGFVVVADADGKTKKISPTRLNEVWTYPLTRDRRPTDLVFHERSRDTAKRLAVSTRMTGMEWPVKP